jgi:hypothetical protein
MKLDLTERRFESVNCCKLAHGRVRYWSFVNMTVNIGLYRSKKCLEYMLKGDLGWLIG